MGSYDFPSESYSHLKVVQELRCGSDTGHEEIVTGASAGDVEEMSLSVVDIF